MASAGAPTPGPSWQVIALGAIAIVFSLVGLYARSIDRRVGILEDKYARLYELILKDYHSKTELNAVLTEVKSAVSGVQRTVSAIMRRLDRGGIPYVAPGEADL